MSPNVMETREMEKGRLATDMLERFRAAKQPEIQALQALELEGRMPAPFAGARPSFSRALQGASLAVIAEYKRASPSKGVINKTLGPEDVARAYSEGGAAALSVLTEERHFQGELAFLERMAPVGLPLLRKDFILHPAQVVQTAATPASALLLIVRMLEDTLLAELLAQSAGFGLEAVVEAFDGHDLERAKQAGAQIIQINNRDLDTLRTDLAVSEKLVQHKDAGELWISASGIERPQDLQHMQDMGYDAVLVGTSLMASTAPGHALRELRKGVAS